MINLLPNLLQCPMVYFNFFLLQSVTSNMVSL